MNTLVDDFVQYLNRELPEVQPSFKQHKECLAGLYHKGCAVSCVKRSIRSESLTDVSSHGGIARRLQELQETLNVVNLRGDQGQARWGIEREINLQRMTLRGCGEIHLFEDESEVALMPAIGVQGYYPLLMLQPDRTHSA